MRELSKKYLYTDELQLYLALCVRYNAVEA